MAEETKELEYRDKLIMDKFEVGKIESSELMDLISKVPLSKSPTFFGFEFNAKENAIPKSSGEIRVNGNGFYVGEIRYPLDLAYAVSAGRLAELEIDFPNFNEGVEGLMGGGKTLETFGRGPLKILRKNSYELVVPSFKIGHYVVKTKNAYPGFGGMISRTVVPRMSLRTEEMVKGEEPRKLVFSYDSSVINTPEFNAYTELIRAIGKSKK